MTAHNQVQISNTTLNGVGVDRVMNLIGCIQADDEDTQLADLIPVVIRGLAALAAGLSLLLCSAWVIAQPGLVMYLQAATWSMSFVFLAMSIDSQSPSSSFITLAIGVMLLMIALSSRLLGPEIILLGTLLVAAWLIDAIFRR